jgi:hypothetical protein
MKKKHTPCLQTSALQPEQDGKQHTICDKPKDPQ